MIIDVQSKEDGKDTQFELAAFGNQYTHILNTSDNTVGAKVT
jgi:hypothetical protein